MIECLRPSGAQGNPSSAGHEYGRRARGLVEKARAQVAAAIGARPDCIVWTSGATESDNLAVFGVARFNADRGRHLVSAKTEHKAVLDPLKQLEREGFEVTWLKPDCDGIVRPEQVRAALRPDTQLVSLMHVNNEIGVVQDIAAVGAICRERGVAFHVDAAQSAGKLPLNVEAMNVDLLSLTAHKIYGPKGIGALYVRRKPPLGLKPLIYGGGQEHGLRSGTLATHQIVGMGLAFEIAERERQQDVERIGALRDKLWAGISERRRRRAEWASAAARRRPAQRQLPRHRRREPAVRAARAGRLGRIRVLFGFGRSVVRAACTGTQRPAGAELAALQPRAVHDGRAGRDCDRGGEARSHAVTFVLLPKQSTRSRSHERRTLQSARHRAFRAATQRRALRAGRRRDRCVRGRRRAGRTVRSQRARA